MFGGKSQVPAASTALAPFNLHLSTSPHALNSHAPLKAFSAFSISRTVDPELSDSLESLNSHHTSTRRRRPAIMATSSREGPKPAINRQTTTPFHLKLFYRVSNFHPLSDYSIPAPPRRGGGPVSGPNAIRAPSPPAAAPLPPHLEIYTWQSCTLRELSQLLTSALPSLLPDPPVGTRLCFRLIYPDARGAAIMGPDARGRYVSKDLGSVIVAPRDSAHYADEEDTADARPRPGPPRFQGSEADKALQDARFIVGDYIECAILPPLDDGSVAPALRGGSGPPQMGGGGGGMRAFRENGYGRPGRGGPRGGDRGPPSLPVGDWKRGERLPEGGGRGGGRRGWAPY